MLIVVDSRFSEDWGIIVENPLWSDEEDSQKLKPQKSEFSKTASEKMLCE